MQNFLQDLLDPKQRQGLGPMLSGQPQGVMAGQPQAPQPGAAAANPVGGAATPLDPNLMSAIAGTYGDVLGGKRADKQMQQANTLRNTPMQGMRHTRGASVAAHPLELAGQLAQRYVGQKQYNKAEQKGETHDAAQVASLQDFVNQMMGKKDPLDTGNQSLIPGQGSNKMGYGG